MSDSARSQNVLSASVQWNMTIWVCAYLNQWEIVMRVTWTSLFLNMAEIDLAPRLNAVSQDKKSASVRQADVLTNFNPIWPRQKNLQLYDKNSASVRQPLAQLFDFYQIPLCVKSLETLWIDCDSRFPCVLSYLPEVRKHSNSCWSEVSNAIRDRVVYLSSRKLSKVPEAVSDLTELEELDLPDNYLEELPTSINKLKNLTRLTSEVNQLRELPQAIAELSNLTVLSVSKQLSVLPSNIKHLKNLRRLYLSSNQLAALPDEIGELKELEWLNERIETGDWRLLE